MAAHRHRAAPPPRRRRSALDRVLSGFGELLITVGIVVALFLVWQLWWTGIAANQKAEASTLAFHETQVESPKKEGTKHTDPFTFWSAFWMATRGWSWWTNRDTPCSEA